MRPSSLGEDAFGTPPAARGGMMKVAGASDEDHGDGKQLINDVDGEPDDYKGNDSMGAPLYPEGTLRLRLGDLRTMISEVIRKQGNKWILYTKHKKGGKHRKLGTHSSLASAKRQERAIHSHGG